MKQKVSNTTGHYFRWRRVDESEYGQIVGIRLGVGLNSKNAFALQELVQRDPDIDAREWRDVPMADEP